MIKGEVSIPVLERNDPLLRLGITVTDPETDVTTPYNFTGALDVRFIVKKGVSAPDSEAMAVYDLADGVEILAPATDGKITVQVASADIGAAGVFRYRVDVVKADGKLETVMAGPFIVKNV